MMMEDEESQPKQDEEGGEGGKDELSAMEGGNTMVWDELPLPYVTSAVSASVTYSLLSGGQMPEIDCSQILCQLGQLVLDGTSWPWRVALWLSVT